MIGIMQGRLTPMVAGKIQSFPEKFWKAEFFIAQALGFSSVEWTLDRDRIMENPFFTAPKEITQLSKMTDVVVPSLTYDAAMQKPLVVKGAIVNDEVELLIKVLAQAQKLGLKLLVLPLVDQSSVNDYDYPLYVDLLRKISDICLGKGLKIAVESDFPPLKLEVFMRDVGSSFVGVNYDIGNSASLGFDFIEEMVAIGPDILNIHVKDRPLNGATCAFGEGAPGLEDKLSYLSKSFLTQNMIIQGARSETGDDIGVALKYLNFVEKAIAQ